MNLKKLLKIKLIAYIWNILVAIDQLGNTLLGGDPDETISSRAGKNRGDCILCNILCRLLDIIDPGHCDKYIEHDEGKDSVIK